MENSAERMCIHPHLASVYFTGLKRVFIRRDENVSPLCIVHCLLHTEAVCRTQLTLWC